MVVIKKIITMAKNSFFVSYEDAIIGGIKYSLHAYFVPFSAICFAIFLAYYSKSLSVFVIAFSAIALFYWELINRYFYKLQFSPKKITSSFYTLFIMDRDVRLTELTVEGCNIKNEIKDFQHEDINYYFIWHKETSDKCKKYIIECLKFNDTFFDLKQLNIFFSMSLLSINILYMSIMLSIYANIEENIFLKENKEILIIVCTIVFFTVIMFILQKINPMSEILSDYNANSEFVNQIEKVTIYRAKNKNVNEVINFNEKIKFMRNAEKSLNDRKAQLFQIATPIFYLAQITILVSYYK